MKRYGFLEIRPATQLTGPGTFVAVDNKTENYVMVHPICDMDSAELANFWQKLPVADTDIGSELAGSSNSGPIYLNALA